MYQLTLFETPASHLNNRPLQGKLLSDSLRRLLKTVEVDDLGEGAFGIALPQVSREEYSEFKELVEILRGAWKRHRQTHIFSYDPTPAIAAILETGRLPEKNPFAFYSTPKAVFEEMLLEADLKNGFLDGGEGLRFLEPSAGQGAIALFVAQLFPKAVIDCVEIDPFNRLLLERLPEVNLVGRDFLECNLAPVYDYCLINPPFTSSQDNHAYIAHIQRAFALLKTDGRLVSVVPRGFRERDDGRSKAFRNFVAQQGYWGSLPDEVFKDSGTLTSTDLIVMRHHSPKELERLSQPHQGLPSWWAFNLAMMLESESEWHDFFCLQSRHLAHGEEILNILHFMNFKIQEFVARWHKDGQAILCDDTTLQQCLTYFRKKLENKGDD